MNCKALPSGYHEFKIRFMSWDLSNLDFKHFAIAKKLLEQVRSISQESVMIELLNDLDIATYSWVMRDYEKRPLNKNGFIQILNSRITRDDAKSIKSEFVNMSQTYNGYEITDMWNMMCDQLFDQLEEK